MKKILYITFKSPYPDSYGYPIRAFNIGKALAKKYEVDLLYLGSGGQNQGHVKVLERTFHRVIPFSFFKSRFILNGLFGIPGRLPLQVNYFFFPEVREWVHDHAKGYDLIFSSTIRTIEYTRGLPVKKAIDLIDDLSLSYKEFHQLASFPWKTAYFIDWIRIRDYYQKYLGSFEKIFITSPFDASHLASQVPELASRIVILPNGIREHLFEVHANPTHEKDQIIFFGKMDYFPNRDAALYFIHEIFPELRSRFPYLEFLIIGKNPPRRFQRLFQRNVRTLGFVEDPYAELLASKIIVTPIRAGAGIQNKILEAMALKKANIISPVASRGIGGVDGKHYLIAKNKKEWIDKISTLLEDDGARKTIGENAYTLTKERYRWSLVGDTLLREIDALL